VTDSGVRCPFGEGFGRARVPWPARARGRFRGEFRLRVADPPLDERPVERPFDARLVDRGLDEPPRRPPDPPRDERTVGRLLDVRVVERDLEELDEPLRREDVFGWAIPASWGANPVLNTLPRRSRCNPAPLLSAGRFSSASAGTALVYIYEPKHRGWS
jgi:hypothetical protein